MGVYASLSCSGMHHSCTRKVRFISAFDRNSLDMQLVDALAGGASIGDDELVVAESLRRNIILENQSHPRVCLLFALQRRSFRNCQRQVAIPPSLSCTQFASPLLGRAPSSIELVSMFACAACNGWYSCHMLLHYSFLSTCSIVRLFMPIHVLRLRTNMTCITVLEPFVAFAAIDLRNLVSLIR